ncbi:MAG: RNA-binding transcriptional accessory protein [Bacteroidales bacterium]|nr:RNA-binding transcriptional accessory protein [Bacteroidales bacterium]
MKPIYVNFIAEHLQVKVWQVENCAALFAEGCTIPFISRYRKERTGGLDDVEVSEIKHWTDVFEEMDKRKTSILATIEELGKLTPELRDQIDTCVSASELEDLYLPYRPKRKTRATTAIANGLEPLADKMWDTTLHNPEAEASRYINDNVPTADDALSGARDIIAERISDTASIRENLRQIYRHRRIVSKATKAASDTPEAAKYRTYFDFTMPLDRIPSHNLLAILRAQNEGFLSVRIDADPEKCSNKIYYDFCQEHGYPSKQLAPYIREAVEDSLKRLLDPSISGEVLREAKEKADIESVKVFGENLRQLLLAPPVGQKRIMAIDPGFRTGCKVVCLDSQGALLHYETIFPHPPAAKKIESINAVSDMIERYDIEVIAIGNGTASRETEDFIRKCYLPDGVRVFTVSEDGASIYSASEVARKEFPDHDVTVRGAVSIGRRLMDPLAELVKIDPKSLGVGQYQHDVDQSLLKEKLDNTVVICVNSVGVNLNTASPYLLQYVSGIGPSLAGNIITHRSEIGGYTSRRQLLDVPRLGAKAYEQCAGFLRIHDADNPLDNSAVHPECYHIVDRMASDLGVSTKELVGNAGLCEKIKAEDYVEGDFGLPTIRDILEELVKPGLDPRESAREFSFSEDIREIDDLRPGMELPGIVTNITNFGAFVDIGLHENGLIHVSQMGVRGVADPSKVLKLHQQITVRVLAVDMDRRRISLALVVKPKGM